MNSRDVANLDWAMRPFMVPYERRHILELEMEDRQVAYFAGMPPTRDLPNSLEPGEGMMDSTKLEILLRSPESYFDPLTGVCIEEGKGLLPCRQRHLNRGTIPEYLIQPCEDCEIWCGCDRDEWPDVFVRTVEGNEIRIGYPLVQGSLTLQFMLKALEEEGELVEVSEAEENACCKALALQAILKELEDEEDEEENENPGLLDLFEPPRRWMIDLRGEGGKATLGLTEEEWRIAETFMGLHYDHIDELIAAERRAREFFRLSWFQRPPRDAVNFWSFPDWEEEFFGEKSVMEFLRLGEIFRILLLDDAHRLYAKWTLIFRGIPNIQDFGRGNFATEMTPEEEEAGCLDFVGAKAKRPTVWFKKNFHQDRIPDYHIPKVSPFTCMLWPKRIWNRYPIEICRYWNR